MLTGSALPLIWLSPNAHEGRGERNHLIENDVPRIADDHWTDPGGRTIDALKLFLGGAVPLAVLDIELLDSVEDLRRVVFAAFGVG